MMKKIFFILLSLLSSAAYAEVFKCQLESGRTTYQSTPCPSAVKQKTIEIKPTDPHQAAEQAIKLKAWEEDFALREAARIQAEKELQAELDRKASVEALQKSADYQRQQAYEAKRQADALELRSYQQPLYYPTYPSLPLYSPHSHRSHEEKTYINTPPSDPTEPKSHTGRDNDNSGASITIKLK